jgi:uncharacterized membrane protein
MIGRVAFRVIIAGLISGLALYAANQESLALPTLTATLALMIVLPVANVIVVLVDEIRRRDWTFAAIAAAVLVLLAHSVLDRLLR